MKLGWTYVNEELPPVGVKVLVATRNENFTVSSIYEHRGKYRWKGSLSFSDSVEKWRYILSEDEIKTIIACKLFTKGIDKHIIDEILKEF